MIGHSNFLSTEVRSKIGGKKSTAYLIILIAFFGCLLSISQILGESPDYENYLIFFDLLREDGLDAVYSYRFELGFKIFAFALISLFDSSSLVFSSFVMVIMSMKVWTIHFISASRPVFFIVILFYFVRYFPLYELTQLRAAFAIAFLMISAVLFWHGNAVYGLLTCIAAILFHMSAIAVIPALFFRSTSRRNIVLLGVSIYFIVLLVSNLVVDFLPEYISVFSNYQSTGFGDVEVNQVSFVLILDWLVILISLSLWQKLSPIMMQVVILEVIGMAVFYGAVDFPVVAHRIREFFSVFWIFYVADGLNRKFINIPVAGFVLASMGLYSYLFVLSGNFFH